MTSSNSNPSPAPGASPLKGRNVGLYYVLGAVILSTSVLVFGFEHQLKETTEQTVTAFRADNASALAAGDVHAITSRLNALMSSVNWVCVSAQQGDQAFFEQRRGSCGSSFFQREIQLADGTQSETRVVLTLRLPRTLERSFIAELCLHLLCLGVIFWGAKRGEAERHLEEARREEERHREEVRRAELLAELASQVAHDIRSPLAALDSAMDDAAQLPERKRVMIRSALNRIRDIANNLRERRSPQRPSENDGRAAPSLHLLSSSLDSLVSEKREEFRVRRGIEVHFPLDETSYGLFAEVQPNEFKTALSNLINNAVEAMGERGQVKVTMSADDGKILLRVQDDGKGIPAATLALLGRRGETHGKAGGSGLGLYHARSAVESWGGSLDIESEVGRGTTVRLTLPAAPPPAWWVSRLEIDADAAVVVLDDEPSIHGLWRGRFEALPASPGGVEAVYVFTAEAALDWTRKNPEKARTALFLADYELIGQNETGLSLIAELGVAERAILVTSRFEEEPVLSQCRQLGVRLIPKNLAAFVPLAVREKRGGEASSWDAVLIDDDALVREVWRRSAGIHGKRLKSYAGIEGFLEEADGIGRRTPIYVDSRLDDGRRGEDFARELRARGFETVYLETGEPAENLGDLPWITQVVGKSPPWGPPAA